MWDMHMSLNATNKGTNEGANKVTYVEAPIIDT